MKQTALAIVTAGMALVACGHNPAGSDTLPPPEGAFQSPISAVAGPGVGGVSVTPQAMASKTFDAIIRVRVQKARANATYYIQRAPEVGRANGADGICQRALGQSPWSPSDPPAASFVTFPQPNSPGPLVALTTLPDGSGSLEFEYGTPNIPAGMSFDVMFRLVDDVNAPTSELRSGCFTVTAK
ncbi:MAG: hypothetical protein DMF78_16890 [Acidobacteria bacterium]|nr:MAG: hypothetical protein DMF78_16890 [Acidobacteriota bacterium]